MHLYSNKMFASTSFVKISFLSHLFSSCIIKKSNKKYLLELYLSVHHEDTDITEDELTDITIANVLVNDLFNDLGVCVSVGDRLVILKRWSQ